MFVSIFSLVLQDRTSTFLNSIIVICNTNKMLLKHSQGAVIPSCHKNKGYSFIILVLGDGLLKSDPHNFQYLLILVAAAPSK